MIKKTPHIDLKDSEIGFGKTVLMPGDPLRAKYIADNFLENSSISANVAPATENPVDVLI